MRIYYCPPLRPFMPAEENIGELLKTLPYHVTAGLLGRLDDAEDARREAEAADLHDVLLVCDQPPHDVLIHAGWFLGRAAPVIFQAPLDFPFTPRGGGYRCRTFDEVRATLCRIAFSGKMLSRWQSEFGEERVKAEVAWLRDYDPSIFPGAPVRRTTVKHKVIPDPPELRTDWNVPKWSDHEKT